MNGDVLDKILNTPEGIDVNEVVESVVKPDFDLKKEINNKLAYTRKATINDIIPEEYQQKLMAIDTTLNKCFWMIGDITEDLLHSINRERASEAGLYITQQDIFEAVGFFCHRTARSIRHYWEIAHYFPGDIRNKYDASFTAFTEARWVSNWELFLQIADENPMWSVERVRVEYHERTGEERKYRVEREGHQAVEKEEPELPEDGEAWSGDGSKRRFKDVLLGKLERTVDELRYVARKIPMPDDIQMQISDVILDIENISLAIRREI